MNDCLEDLVRSRRSLIIASNRGPITFQRNEEDEMEYERGTGGLVTALMGLVRQIDATWIAAAHTEEDSLWKQGKIVMDGEENTIQVKFITCDPQAYEWYYNVIANPLLWFLQHSMWDLPRSPIINRSTWQAWEQGYSAINRQFAEQIVDHVRSIKRPALVMLQDYHLYLVGRYLHDLLEPEERPTTTHFVHIPWPGPEYWGILPPAMRQPIIGSLCAVDLLGFQTQEDGLNFLRTCETYLPNADVNYHNGSVQHRDHIVYARDFPISIDVGAIRELANTRDVKAYKSEIQDLVDGQQMILRIDRTEPSKNIVRGFRAYEELLELYPEHHGKVKFLAFLVPSRLDVDEYQDYLDELMAAAGRVNTNFGDSEWEPLRLFTSESYPRAVAAMQLYDVLLINAIADGMNLVAKEGPIVNRKNGVLILSERAGATQQLGEGAIVISPCDVYATAEAMHEALIMDEDEKAERQEMLVETIEHEDIMDWICRQFDAVSELGL
jgi:trehalose 6-phosphate synthase